MTTPLSTAQPYLTLPPLPPKTSVATLAALVHEHSRVAGNPDHDGEGLFMVALSLYDHVYFAQEIRSDWAYKTQLGTALVLALDLLHTLLPEGAVTYANQLTLDGRAGYVNHHGLQDVTGQVVHLVRSYAACHAQDTEPTPSVLLHAVNLVQGLAAALHDAGADPLEVMTRVNLCTLLLPEPAPRSYT